MAIDWRTALHSIDGDTSSIAVELRGKVTSIGTYYDSAGQPSVMTESSAHVAWRAAMVSELTTRDRAAASVDGQPPTVIDPANPNAATATIIKRLSDASSKAQGAIGPLIADMLGAKLPSEPNAWIDAFYTRAPFGSSFQTVGDIQAALIAALAELSAYVGFRG